MRITASLVVLLALAATAPFVGAQPVPSHPWRVNANANAGPLMQLDLPNSNGKRRGVIVAFEYARRCDPIFSYLEMTGDRLGIPKSQAVLTGSKTAVILNGVTYTGHAAQTTYDNGYEAGFGMPNDLVVRLLLKIDSMAYVTPAGDHVSLSTNNFDQAFREAIEICAKRMK